MKHPEVLLIPIMMFLDYFLTVLGAIQSEKKYSLHFRSEHYELNPILQKDIARKKWFNPRHVALTVLVSAILICLVEMFEISDDFVQLILGCLLVLCGMILGRHFSNLLIFRYLVRKPDAVSGEVTMSHHFNLSVSLYQSLMVMIPVILIALFSHSQFALGGIIGIALSITNHFKWLRKANKHRTSSNKTDSGDTLLRT